MQLFLCTTNITFILIVFYENVVEGWIRIFLFQCFPERPRQGNGREVSGNDGSAVQVSVKGQPILMSWVLETLFCLFPFLFSN